MWNHVPITTIYLMSNYLVPVSWLFGNFIGGALPGVSVTGRRDLRYIAEPCLSKLDFLSIERWGSKQSLPNVPLAMGLPACMPPPQKYLSKPSSKRNYSFLNLLPSDLHKKESGQWSSLIRSFDVILLGQGQMLPIPFNQLHIQSHSITEPALTRVCFRCFMCRICLTLFYHDFCFEDWWGEVTLITRISGLWKQNLKLIQSQIILCCYWQCWQLNLRFCAC